MLLTKKKLRRALPKAWRESHFPSGRSGYTAFKLCTIHGRSLTHIKDGGISTDGRQRAEKKEMPKLEML
jgi:hypothetical protein